MSEFQNQETPIFNDTIQPYAKKEPAAWQKRDTVFAVITIIVSVLFVSLSLFGGFKLGFTVSYVLLFMLTAAYMLKSEIKLTPFPVFCGAVSLALSVVFTLYCDALINFLLFFAIFLLYGLFTALVYGKTNHKSIIFKAFDILIISPLCFIAEPLRSYGKYCKDNDKSGPNKQVILGVALSIPLLAVILPLLISSDAAFEGLMVTLFSGVGTLITKIILGLFFAVCLFSLLFMLKKELNREQTAITQVKTAQGIPIATSVTLLSIISVFYAAYLFSQAAYFFSGFAGILPEGYTFTVAAYARRGFFELCAVCSINLAIIAIIASLSSRDENGRRPLPTRIALTVICSFSIFFTLTAISKMWLYIGFYTLTRLRLLTTLFMVLLVLVFIGITVFLHTKKFPLAKYTVIVLAVMAIIIGFGDIDKTVARYNVAAYRHGWCEKLIDVPHLGELSDSAVPYLVELLNGDNSVISESAALELYERALEYYEIEEENGSYTVKPIEKTELSEYNYSKNTAKSLIGQNIKKILKAKPYYTTEDEASYVEDPFDYRY